MYSWIGVVLLISSLALSKQIFVISHAQFVSLSEENQEIYVHALRSAIPNLVSDNKKVSILEMLFNKANANNVKDTKCVSLGLMVDHPLFDFICGDAPGVKSSDAIQFSCDPLRVGIENKFPCLPVALFGYDEKGFVSCVSGNPNVGLRSFFKSCDEKTKPRRIYVRKAAKSVVQDPTNYEKIREFVLTKCKENNVGQCRTVIAALEAAANRVLAHSTDDKKVQHRRRASGQSK